MTGVDYHALSDRDLADTLVRAELQLETTDAGISLSLEEATEVSLFCLNEIADRLSLPLDQTEQGLTPEASELVDKWVAETRGEEQ